MLLSGGKTFQGGTNIWDHPCVTLKTVPPLPTQFKHVEAAALDAGKNTTKLITSPKYRAEQLPIYF